MKPVFCLYFSQDYCLWCTYLFKVWNRQQQKKNSLQFIKYFNTDVNAMTGLQFRTSYIQAIIQSIKRHYLTKDKIKQHIIIYDVLPTNLPDKRYLSGTDHPIECKQASGSLSLMLLPQNWKSWDKANKKHINKWKWQNEWCRFNERTYRFILVLNVGFYSAQMSPDGLWAGEIIIAVQL